MDPSLSPIELTRDWQPRLDYLSPGTWFVNHLGSDVPQDVWDVAACLAGTKPAAYVTDLYQPQVTTLLHQLVDHGWVALRVRNPRYADDWHRIVVAPTLDLATELAVSIYRGDHHTTGRLLGYPEEVLWPSPARLPRIRTRMLRIW